jgi:2-polyprenyl-6-hydroxyphenyl methylase/3-demethylubiquinone-9 3-methyltransferase
VTHLANPTKYSDNLLHLHHDYVLPTLMRLCGARLGPQTRVLDVGCGNGAVANEFVKLGCKVVGIDLSDTGIGIARELCPMARFEVLPADANVLRDLGEEPFDLVYSLEVIEHLYDPRSFLDGCFAATKPGCLSICSTPYHGYLKNLMLAALDGWDNHHCSDAAGSHIKFFSRNTLSALFTEAGFHQLQFRGAGRAPYLWKSMLISGMRP